MGKIKVSDIKLCTNRELLEQWTISNTKELIIALSKQDLMYNIRHQQFILALQKVEKALKQQILFLDQAHTSLSLFFVQAAADILPDDLYQQIMEAAKKLEEESIQNHTQKTQTTVVGKTSLAFFALRPNACGALQ